jgi:hypothetical protein
MTPTLAPRNAMPSRAAHHSMSSSKETQRLILALVIPDVPIPAQPPTSNAPSFVDQSRLQAPPTKGNTATNFTSLLLDPMATRTLNTS